MDQQIADAFAHFVQSVFIPNKPQLNVTMALASAGIHNFSQFVSVYHIAESEINVALKELKYKFTEGSDGIPQVIIRDCRDIFAKPLYHILNGN